MRVVIFWIMCHLSLGQEKKALLKEGGIQLSDGGKGKRKAELVDLCEKAAEMRQAKLEDTVEDYNKLLEEKL